MGIFSRVSNLQWAAGATIIASLVSILIFLFGDGILNPKAHQSPTTDRTTPPNADSERVRVVEDKVRLEITAIRRSGSSLYVEYLVTALEKDQDWLLYGMGRTRIITPEGDEHRTPTVTLGSKLDSTDVITRLIAGVPMKAHHEFKDFPSNASAISVLEVSGQFKNPKWTDWNTSFPPLSIDE